MPAGARLVDPPLQSGRKDSPAQLVRNHSERLVDDEDVHSPSGGEGKGSRERMNACESRSNVGNVSFSHELSEKLASGSEGSLRKRSAF